MTIKTPENIGVTPAGGGNVYGQDTGTAGLLNGVTPAGGSNVYVDDTGWIPYPPKTVTAGFLNVSGSPSQNALVVTSAQSTSSITARQYVYGDFVGARNINVQETMLRSDPNGTVVYDTQNNRTGFENGLADATVSMVDGTRRVTVTPTGASYDLWIAGKCTVISTPLSLVISNVEGNHYVYFDSTATLTELVNPTHAQYTSFLTSPATATAAYIYWNAAGSVHIFLAPELHSIKIMPADHAYKHTYFHTQWTDGLGLNNIVADGSGNSNASAQWGVDSGDIADEDLAFGISGVSSTTGLPVMYNSGLTAALRTGTQAGYSVLNAPGGLCYFNDPNAGGAGVWGLTAVTTGNYVLYHVFATTASDRPLISVMGQAQYTTVALARAGAPIELGALLLTFPASEFKPLGTVICECSNGHSNAVKMRVRSTDTGFTYTDWRQVFTGSGIPTTGTGLTGSGLTNNYLTKYNGAQLVNSSTIDDGTTVTTTTDLYVGAINLVAPKVAIGFGTSSAAITVSALSNVSGVVHSTITTGNLTSSNVVDVDIDPAAAITFSKINHPTTVAGYGITDQINIGYGTANHIPKWTNSSGNQVNSLITDDGTSLTYGGTGTYIGGTGGLVGNLVYDGGTGKFTIGNNGAGAITIAASSAITIANLAGTAGIVHSSSIGLLSNSLIVDADITSATILNRSISASAAIALEKLAATGTFGTGTGGTVLTSFGIKVGQAVATPTAGSPLCIGSNVVGGYSSINFGALNGVSTAQNGAVVFSSGASTATTGIGFQADNLNYQLQCFQDGHTECSGAVSIRGAVLSARALSVYSVNTTNLVIEAIESAGVHSIYVRPKSAAGVNLISSNYLSGAAYNSLCLSGRETATDLVCSTDGGISIGTATSPGAGKLRVANGITTNGTNFWSGFGSANAGTPAADSYAGITIDGVGYLVLLHKS